MAITGISSEGIIHLSGSESHKPIRAISNQINITNIQVGDLVRSTLEQYPIDAGVVLDTYEDDYGIVYYEVHWTSDVEWWKEDELELISEGG